jgi:hypothetical protein
MYDNPSSQLENALFAPHDSIKEIVKSKLSYSNIKNPYNGSVSLQKYPENKYILVCDEDNATPEEKKSVLKQERMLEIFINVSKEAAEVLRSNHQRHEKKSKEIDNSLNLLLEFQRDFKEMENEFDDWVKCVNDNPDVQLDEKLTAFRLQKFQGFLSAVESNLKNTRSAFENEGNSIPTRVFNFDKGDLVLSLDQRFSAYFVEFNNEGRGSKVVPVKPENLPKQLLEVKDNLVFHELLENASIFVKQLDNYDYKILLNQKSVGGAIFKLLCAGIKRIFLGIQSVIKQLLGCLCICKGEQKIVEEVVKQRCEQPISRPVGKSALVNEKEDQSLSVISSSQENQESDHSSRVESESKKNEVVLSIALSKIPENQTVAVEDIRNQNISVSELDLEPNLQAESLNNEISLPLADSNQTVEASYQKSGILKRSQGESDRYGSQKQVQNKTIEQLETHKYPPTIDSERNLHIAAGTLSMDPACLPRVVQLMKKEDIDNDYTILEFNDAALPPLLLTINGRKDLIDNENIIANANAVAIGRSLISDVKRTERNKNI